jgi:hypothetical protein
LYTALTRFGITKPVPEAKKVNKNWRRFMINHLFYMGGDYAIFIIIIYLVYLLITVS